MFSRFNFLPISRSFKIAHLWRINSPNSIPPHFSMDCHAFGSQWHQDLSRCTAGLGVASLLPFPHLPYADFYHPHHCMTVRLLWSYCSKCPNHQRRFWQNYSLSRHRVSCLIMYVITRFVFTKKFDHTPWIQLDSWADPVTCNDKQICTLICLRVLTSCKVYLHCKNRHQRKNHQCLQDACRRTSPFWHYCNTHWYDRNSI